MRMSQDIMIISQENMRIFFFVFLFYPNFFLFKNIKKILINTNDFCSNYQIKFFLKYRKKSYVKNVWRKKNKKPKMLILVIFFHQIAYFIVKQREYIF